MPRVVIYANPQTAKLTPHVQVVQPCARSKRASASLYVHRVSTICNFLVHTLTRTYNDTLARFEREYYNAVPHLCMRGKRKI